MKLPQLYAAAAISLALPSTSQAILSFTFDYSAAPDFNATSRASLEATAAGVGNWFNHTATINMAVTSSNNPLSSTLASAGSNGPTMGPGLQPGAVNRAVVGTKILGGGDLNGAIADGTVDVNFAIPWDFDDSVDASMFDFKSTMAHELLHAVGFLSQIDSAGSSFGVPAGTPGAPFGVFDEFVADSTGRIIDPGTNTADGARYVQAVTEGAGTQPVTPNSGLYFDGPNAKAMNGGNAVPLYTPTTYEDGSSGAHLDDQFFTGSNQKMMNAATIPGPGIRNLSMLEIGMLTDLGFNINADAAKAGLVITPPGGGGTAVPEPTFAFVLAFLGLCTVGRRRRA